jgi:serine/threonine-protein kinase TTK/MPS1
VGAQAEAQSQSQEHARQSPSPTHLTAASHLRYGHKRRDSDTVKSHSAHHIQPSISPTCSPPPIEALPARLSPSAQQLKFATNSNSNHALSSSASARHRRSPTAPDPPTTSGTLHTGSGLGREKSWAGGEMGVNVDEFGANPSSLNGVPTRQQHARHPQQQYPPAPELAPGPQSQTQQHPDARSSRTNMVVSVKLELSRSHANT